MSLSNTRRSVTAAKPYSLRPPAGRQAHWLHAGAILMLPTIAAAGALAEAIAGGVAAWQPLLAVIGYGLTMLGITVGFHRLLSHRAFETWGKLRALFAILGSMAAQGPPIYWVSNHRRHHQFSDAEGDPHSPHWRGQRPLATWRGFWHAHVGWTFTHEMTNSAVYSRDLLRDGIISWVNRHYYKWVMLGLVLPTGIGALITASAEGAWQGLLWGGGVRLFISYHLTNAINSVTHLFGYRSFATREDSRNNAWLGLITLGEAWHNNHHACPRSAIFGLSWWEADIGGLVIMGLERLGLVWRVRRPVARYLDRQRLKSAESAAPPTAMEPHQ
jgi:stearoyl-CoA desaturase (Delta-9 desaturase)